MANDVYRGIKMSGWTIKEETGIAIVNTRAAAMIEEAHRMRTIRDFYRLMLEQQYDFLGSHLNREENIYNVQINRPGKDQKLYGVSFSFWPKKENE